MHRALTATILTLALAAGAPALAQSEADRAQADPRLADRRLAGAAEAPAPRPTVVHRTPEQVEDARLACQADVDCAPDLEGEPRRPVRRWAVRSSRAPADADFQPTYPIAIIADVEAEMPRRRPRRPRH